MKKKISSIAIAIVLSAGIFIASAQAKDDIKPITVYYHERIPYLQETTDGSITGLYADALVFAFKRAKVPYKLVAMPAKRQMKYLEEKKGRICLVGWYKNAEREKFAQYSHYVYQDKQRIAIAKKENMKVKSGDTVGNVISNPGIRVLVKSGYSYGKFLDAQFEKYKPTFETTVKENIHMLKMIHARRADLLFMSQEEADSLIAKSGIPKEDFVYISFSDMPDGYKRYMLFSMQVEPETIDLLNRAIIQYSKQNNT